MKIGILGTGVVGQTIAMKLVSLGHDCTSGTASLDALRQASAPNLDGKIIVDVANPLDFSKRIPPTLSVCNTDSLGEQIQRASPGARVVKTLNSTNIWGTLETPNINFHIARP